VDGGGDDGEEIVIAERPDEGAQGFEVAKGIAFRVGPFRKKKHHPAGGAVAAEQAKEDLASERLKPVVQNDHVGCLPTRSLKQVARGSHDARADGRSPERAAHLVGSFGIGIAKKDKRSLFSHRSGPPKIRLGADLIERVFRQEECVRVRGLIG
jgi:hypothetical protein